MTNLFVRKATALVRSWSVFDAFIYALFSINLITLGLYSFSQMYYFGGGLVPALIVSALFIFFEVVVYAALIAVMPAANRQTPLMAPVANVTRSLQIGSAWYAITPNTATAINEHINCHTKYAWIVGETKTTIPTEPRPRNVEMTTMPAFRFSWRCSPMRALR